MLKRSMLRNPDSKDIARPHPSSVGFDPSVPIVERKKPSILRRPRPSLNPYNPVTTKGVLGSNVTSQSLTRGDEMVTVTVNQKRRLPKKQKLNNALKNFGGEDPISMEI